LSAEEVRRRLARRFRGQAASCRDLGSPLYGSVLERAADDLDAAGPVWRVTEPVAGLPGGALVALRYLGATHRQALEGLAPDLAAHYPSCGGDGDSDAAWTALLALTEAAATTRQLDHLLARGVQTNEVGRSGALLGGFLEVVRATGMALDLLEVGASAGLNLRWDRFRYDGWGPPDSPVDLGHPWVDGPGPLLSPPAVEIGFRSGCDLAPLDPAAAEGRMTLLSFVWPDMRRRFETLDAACRVAAVVPATVEPAPADEWLPPRLDRRRVGVATVVFHSVVLQYVESTARRRVLEAIAAAGAAAKPDRPLAWLRLEPPGPLGPTEFEVRLTTWPGGHDRVLGMSHPHGTRVRWEACGSPA
jgi:hypothetical protein